MSRTLYPPPGSIKSIQRGDATANVTIAAVNVSKASLTHNGAASNSNDPQNAKLRLTGSTTLTYDKGSLTGTPAVSWELKEYY